MQCREQCAACCEAISISSPIPGLPQGKPAGQPCIHLESQTLRCRIWLSEAYPAVCRNFSPDPEYCGIDRETALRLLTTFETLTKP